MENNKKIVTILDFSKKTKLSHRSIISILGEAGLFVPNDSSSFRLSEKHINVLSSYIIDEVKNHVNESDYSCYDYSETPNFIDIVVGFIKSEDDSTQPLLISSGEDLSNHQDSVYLEDIYGLIRITEIIHTFKKIRYKVAHKIGLRIRRIYKDLREHLFSIIKSYNYYIFTDEEDHFRLANSTFGFSEVKNTFREATFNVIINLKFFQCQKIKFS